MEQMTRIEWLQVRDHVSCMQLALNACAGCLGKHLQRMASIQ
jgi:hypothetical protein